MARLAIGNVALRRDEPRIIAPFTDRTRRSALRTAKKRGLSLLEARIDLFDDSEGTHVIERLVAARTIAPVLATVRSKAEGGKWKQSERARLALYREILPHVDAVDVELDAAIRGDVVRAARDRGRTIILSHHDFEKTPSGAALDRILERSVKAGAHATKIATFVRRSADLATLAGVLARHQKRALVVIGMGEQGKLTRVLFPALGSLMTFASLGRKTAPGQLDLTETVRELGKYLGHRATA